MFEPGRITIQYVAVGFLPWCAATIGFVESTAIGDEEKNLLCPPVAFTGDAADLARLAYVGLWGQVARVRHEVVGTWNQASRLNPAQALFGHLEDPGVAESVAFIVEHTREALKNLEQANAAATRR